MEMFMKLNEVFKKQFHFKRMNIQYFHSYIVKILYRSAQQLADERLGQIRRDQYCIFVPGRPPLTNAQAAREIIEEAKRLIQQDLQAMGFGIVIQKSETVDEDVSNSDTDDSDGEEENDIPSSISSSSIEFPSLLNDKNINIRNAYVNGKYICSEFILMIEHKETIAISCFTKKITKSISGIEFKLKEKKKQHFLFFHRSKCISYK
jgi:hypothetical protein